MADRVYALLWARSARPHPPEIDDRPIAIYSENARNLVAMTPEEARSRTIATQAAFDAWIDSTKPPDNPDATVIVATDGRTYVVDETGKLVPHA